MREFDKCLGVREDRYLPRTKMLPLNRLRGGVPMKSAPGDLFVYLFNLFIRSGFKNIKNTQQQKLKMR